MQANPWLGKAAGVGLLAAAGFALYDVLKVRPAKKAKPSPDGPDAFVGPVSPDAIPAPGGTKVPPIEETIDASETFTVEPTHKMDFAQRTGTVPVAALPIGQAGVFAIELCLRTVHDRGLRWFRIKTGVDSQVPWGMYAGQVATFKLRRRWQGRFDGNGELTSLTEAKPLKKCKGRPWPGELPVFANGNVPIGPVDPQMKLVVENGIISARIDAHPLPQQQEDWGGAVAATYMLEASGVVAWVG